MNEPDPPPLPTDTHPPERALGAGIARAWLVMIIGEFLIGVTGNISLILGGMLLPPLTILIWGIVALTRGDKRLGKGLLLGLASIFAVVLLLVAACFGLVSNLNFH